jgi:hypothetical protein
MAENDHGNDDQSKLMKAVVWVAKSPHVLEISKVRVGPSNSNWAAIGYLFRSC